MVYFKMNFVVKHTHELWSKGIFKTKSGNLHNTRVYDFGNWSFLLDTINGAGVVANFVMIIIICCYFIMFLLLNNVVCNVVEIQLKLQSLN